MCRMQMTECFLYDELGHTDLLLSVQPNPFGATEAYNSVPPISLQTKQLATWSCILFCSSSTQWFLTSTSTTFYTLLCSVTQGPNLFWHTLQRIPSWKLMSKGEREFTSKLNPSKGGENASNMGREELHTPDAWCSRGEKSHVFRGERHVHVVCVFSLLWFSVPYLLPVSHIRFRGSKTSKGRKSSNSLHIFTFGDMSTLK